MASSANQLICSIGLFALLASCVTGSSGSILENCGKEPLATVNQVTLTGCDFDADSICTLKRGTDAAIGVNLTPNSEIAEARVKLGAKIGGLFVPFPLKPDDACAAYGLKCPMAASSEQTLSIKMPISPAYPSPPNMKVQVRLVGAGNKEIICVAFPAMIVS